jgi:hypothetical protein
MKFFFVKMIKRLVVFSEQHLWFYLKDKIMGAKNRIHEKNSRYILIVR